MGSSAINASETEMRERLGMVIQYLRTVVKPEDELLQALLQRWTRMQTRFEQSGRLGAMDPFEGVSRSSHRLHQSTG